MACPRKREHGTRALHGGWLGSSAASPQLAIGRHGFGGPYGNRKMAFANPMALAWGLLAIPVVLLYRRDVRRTRVPVAAGMIWQQVLAEEARRGGWQRWRHRVSLAVQLTVLVLLVIALADPQLPAFWPFEWSVRLVPASVAAVLLAVEWGLYQRRWTS